MTDINKLLNTTSAGLLAQKLDAQDGNKDGKISGSVWNEFVEGKGGKKIREDGSISVKDAMNSITTYVIREAKRLGKSVDGLMQEWQPSGSAPAPTENSGSTPQPVEGTDPVTETPETHTPEEAEAAKQAQVQADYQSVKVTVPNRPSSKEYNAIAKGQKEGKQLRNSLKSGKTDGINSGNVAHALGNTLFGPNSQKQAEIVFNALVNRMYDLDIFEDGKDYGRWSSVSKLPYTKQNSLMRNYANRIIKKENEMVRLTKSQKVFDDATKFMAEVANMEPKPEVKRGHNDKCNCDYAQAKLSDGRWIEVRYDNDGKIRAIMISHDTTPDHSSDGSTYDGTEINFMKDNAYSNTNHNKDGYESAISSGYDFEKLKALAEKIFGKKE